jgi:two-component system, NarL family, nitrate/nitrite response regulator NarL
MICGEAEHGFDAIEKAGALKPDLIIMDVTMPRMNGIEATQVIRKEVPNAKVLILSQNDPEILARQAATASAHGYMSKNDIGSHLITLMERIIAA